MVYRYIHSFDLLPYNSVIDTNAGDIVFHIKAQLFMHYMYLSFLCIFYSTYLFFHAMLHLICNLFISECSMS